MAVIDPGTGAVVIRIVYDGAPFAGKTTSLRALAGGLGSAVRSPGEIDGRTLYFDWLDYTGGLFEGRRIRCQIVSVPGQAVLAPRRRRLLHTADAVVYVSDTSAAAFAAENGYLAGMREVLAQTAGPPVGVVLQANKRDAADAVPLDDLRDRLWALGLAASVVETNAAANDGVREAFVFAVRLALDRVRELNRVGLLATRPPDVEDAEGLLAALQAVDAPLRALDDASSLPHLRLNDVMGAKEVPNDATVDASATPGPAMTALESVLAENAVVRRPAPAPVRERGNSERAPKLPDAGVASGLVWPVVVGRTILGEIDPASYVRVRHDGAWESISQRRWRLHSAADARFDDIEAGREALVHWARLHASLAAWLTSERCIVLGADHDDAARAWQVVRIRPTLRTLLDEVLAAPAPVLARALVAAELAREAIVSGLGDAGVAVEAGLADVALEEGVPRYGGAVPMPGRDAPNARRGSGLRHYAFARDTLVGQRAALLVSLRDPLAPPPDTAEPPGPLDLVLARATPAHRELAARSAADLVGRM